MAQHYVFTMCTTRREHGVTHVAAGDGFEDGFSWRGLYFIVRDFIACGVVKLQACGPLVASDLGVLKYTSMLCHGGVPK